MPDRPDFTRFLRTTGAAMRHNGTMRTRRQPERQPGRWRIGVDLGGTWVRVVAHDARGRRRQVKQASPRLAGLPDFLARLWRRWALERDDVRTLVVAAKGVWTRAERRRQERRLCPLARRVRVISDVEAAYLGALGAGAGILLLAGTGSMALGRDARGRWARAGGWGPLLGDEGSAFWIGREWLRATMATTSFTRARRVLESPDPVARIAGLAPDVLRRARHGSRAARRIVARSQAALADLLLKLSQDLDLGTSVPVSWAGGLLEDPRFRAGVWRTTRRAGLGVKPRPPREHPVTAVGRIAQDLGDHEGDCLLTGRRQSPVVKERTPPTLPVSSFQQLGTLL
jgi:N-acetylglucosamine kinase-like BadF-type ATPase